MRTPGSALLVLSLACIMPLSAQEVHAGVGYAHIFRAGGFSFASGYLQPLNAPTSPLQHRVGGDFWYANTDVASQAPGNAARDVVGFGARYELELAHCCGRVHPMLALPVQVLRSSVPTTPEVLPAASRVTPAVVPTPEPPLPSEDQGGSAWGWGAGVELGLRVGLGPQWNLQTSGAAMYQDVYAGSTTNGAWTLHLGLGYRFGGT
jgi:hypothetical protein